MIIGLTGKKRAGKDTAAEYLTDQGFSLYRFADPIKRLVADIFLWDDEWVNGIYKETVDPRWGISPRQAQQLVGTELFRETLPNHCPGFKEVIGSDLWVRRFALWYRFNDLVRDVVIPDVRFPNEAEAIKALGGYIVRIERPGTDKGDSHPSEMEMEKIVPDYVLNNGRGIVDLQQAMAGAYVQMLRAEEVAPVEVLEGM